MPTAPRTTEQIARDALNAVQDRIEAKKARKAGLALAIGKVQREIDKLEVDAEYLAQHPALRNPTDKQVDGPRVHAD